LVVYYTVVLKGRITSLDVRLSCTELAPNSKTIKRRKTKIGVDVPFGRENRYAIFCSKSWRSRS